MIKVKIDRGSQVRENVFYVLDGVTVQYADDVLEVLDEEDAVIAVFRGWVYALPVTDEDYLIETGQADELEDGDDEPAEVDFEAPETSSFVHANNHGGYAPADDVNEDPAQ